MLERNLPNTIPRLEKSKMLLEVKTFYSTDYKKAAVIGQDKESGKKAIYYYVANDNKTYDEISSS